MSIPFIIGRPGAGLLDASWASSAGAAQKGHEGEVRTAALLDREAEAVQGPTVVHDVRIPLPNVKANIDHLIISGNTVTIIDSKVWKPGRYWTMFGSTRRGMEKFPHADKSTMVMARDALKNLAEQNKVSIDFKESLLVIWSSRKYPKMSVRFLKPQGATPISGAVFTKRLSRLFDSQPADSALVSLLLPLVADTTINTVHVTRSEPAVSYTAEEVFAVPDRPAVYSSHWDDEPEDTL